MRIWFLSLFSVGMLHAAPIHTPLLDLNGSHGYISASELAVGMSGFIVRHFDANHSTIIANARVSSLDPSNHRAIIDISKYDGLHQNALPGGKWKPKVNDDVVMTYDYERALLIAPNDDAYRAITKSISTVEWVHPDIFAAYLSYEGHPTPLTKDFNQFCTSNSIGLLYIQSAHTLFKLDCKTFELLAHTPLKHDNNTSMTPFYSRIPSIRADWWGEGSSRLKSYEPYYLEQIALKNRKNKELYNLYKASFSDKSALLHHFEGKE